MDAVARRRVRETIREMLSPTVEELGYELVGVLITGDRSGRILRLCIDRPGGVKVADCTRVSRAVSPELDVEDPLPGRYRLEVSSPGIQRPLQRPSDYQRFRGFRAKIRTMPGVGRINWTGVLLGIDGDTVALDVDGERQAFALEDIDRAHLALTTEQFLRLGRDGVPAVEGEI